MLVVNGYEYSIEIHEQELRLSPRLFGDKGKIDPTIAFTDIMGFEYGKASGYNYVHIRTWNPKGFTNIDMSGTGFLSSLKNRNYIIFQGMFQKAAFKTLCDELTKVVDANQALINERIKIDNDFRREIRTLIEKHELNQQHKSKTFYGIWIDWN